MSFEADAHYQTWIGFNFANMAPRYTGIVEFGSYTSRAAPHHITLRNITILRTCTGPCRHGGREHLGSRLSTCARSCIPVRRTSCSSISTSTARGTSPLPSTSSTNTKAYAIRYQATGGPNPYGIVFRNITTTNSDYKGFCSLLGSAPSDVTTSGDSLR